MCRSSGYVLEFERRSYLQPFWRYSLFSDSTEKFLVTFPEDDFQKLRAHGNKTFFQVFGKRCRCRKIPRTVRKNRISPQGLKTGPFRGQFEDLAKETRHRKVTRVFCRRPFCSGDTAMLSSRKMKKPDLERSLCTLGSILRRDSRIRLCPESVSQLVPNSVEG